VLEMLRDDSCWKDKRKHEFLLGFFKNEAERFTTAPAATDHHHNYKGGLFIHTGDVFSLCKGVVDAPMNALDEGWVNSDVLYMAAWFHDAGKMEVYKMEGDAPKIDSDMERRVGHPTISNQMFTKAAQDFGLSSDFITAVSHCILSHHDRKEWGAVVEPDTIEAKILCRADYISSRKPD
jgi:3'-5' exoribonuclease